MNHGVRPARGALAGLLLAMVGLFAITTTAKAETPPAGAAAKSTAADYLNLLQQVFKSIENNYVESPDPKKLFEGAMKGLFDSLGDPHSYYLTQSQVKDLTDTTRGRFGGVGLIISKPSGTPGETASAQEVPGAGGGGSRAAAPAAEGAGPTYVEVVSPIHGSPAYKAGISAGDRITAIDGASTAPMKIDEVVNMLRGAPGTSVAVTILRGSHISFTATLVRALIDVPVTKQAMIPPHIGYLRIIEYTPLTPAKVLDAVEKLKQEGATSLIIDERGNPGGLLSAVVATCDYFLSKGIIVSTRSRIPAENEIYVAHADTIVATSFPIIVLIDKGSASAAEIFAGAMQDHHRALIVGQTSFGKGSVQQVFFLPDGDGAFKLTTAKYYTPNGQNIDKIGIKPDVVVAEPELTQRDQEDLKKLIEGNVITSFVREDPNAGTARVDAFVAKLHAEGIALGDELLKRLIRSEQDRMQTNPPVYDLAYDKALSEAVKLLQSGQYPGKSG